MRARIALYAGGQVDPAPAARAYAMRFLIPHAVIRRQFFPASWRLWKAAFGSKALKAVRGRAFSALNIALACDVCFFY